MVALTAFEPNHKYTATYAVFEVMVRPQWPKQGFSDRVRTALIEERSEDLTGLRSHGEEIAP
jgi:hypothetical protein